MYCGVHWTQYSLRKVNEIDYLGYKPLKQGVKTIVLIGYSYKYIDN